MSSAILAKRGFTSIRRHALSVHSVACFLHDIPTSWSLSPDLSETAPMNTNRRAQNFAGMLDGGPSAVRGIDRTQECPANRVSSSPASKPKYRPYPKNRPGRLNKATGGLHLTLQGSSHD